MIIRSLVRFWRWLTAKAYDRVSDEWIDHHGGKTYDDNPKAKASRED